MRLLEQKDKNVESQDIKKAGLRLTAPRVKILEVLSREGNRHISAEDIYRMLLADGEEVGLATVYHVLTQFELAGMVIRHRFGNDAAVFELDHGRHDHMVCAKCGKITEFTDDMIEDRLVKVAKHNHFSVSDHTLILYVDCRNKNCKHRSDSV